MSRALHLCEYFESKWPMEQRRAKEIDTRAIAWHLSAGDEDRIRKLPPIKDAIVTLSDGISRYGKQNWFPCNIFYVPLTIRRQ